MNENIKFDFLKAQNLLRVINKCKSSLDNMAGTIDNEIKNLGLRWQGESYDAYRDSYVGIKGGKSTILRIADSTQNLSSYLNMVTQEKKTLEQVGQKSAK